MTDTIPSAPRIQRREVWVDLPAEYAGFRARVWVNAPSGVWAGLSSGDEALARESIKRIVIEHNGWRDFDDQPYPPAHTNEFWDAIPNELATVLIVVASLEMTKLPKSLAQSRRR